MFAQISAVVAVLAALVATAQAILSRRAAHGALVDNLLLAFRSDDDRAARATVYNLGAKPHQDWTPAEIAAAEAVSVQFATLGFMIRNSYLNSRPVGDFWGMRAVRLYRILGPYIEDRRRVWRSPEQWIYFEWLARTAARRLRRMPPWWEGRKWRLLKAATGEIDQDLPSI
jgi:hypothetical protein